MQEKNVEIIEVKEVFNKAIFRIELARLKHQQLDGSMTQQKRNLWYQTDKLDAKTVIALQ